MPLHLCYVSNSPSAALPDSQSVSYARNTLAYFKSFSDKKNTKVETNMSNVLTWDAYRMLLLTEFPELLPYVEWYIDGRRVEMTNTMSYKEYAPEHGLAGTILATIIRHNTEQRKKAAKKEVE